MANIDVDFLDSENAVISSKCPMCSNIQKIEVKTRDVVEWNRGKHIQYAFPYLDASQREALISGYCEPCWDDLWDVDAEDE